MKRAGGGFDQCYNAQAAVDAQQQIIVAAELSNCAADSGQLKPLKRCGCKWSMSCAFSTPTSASNAYDAGDEISVGDIPVGCFAHRWYALPMEHGSHSHVDAWYARLSERPAFRKHVMLPLS